MTGQPPKLDKHGFHRQCYCDFCLKKVAAEFPPRRDPDPDEHLEEEDEDEIGFGTGPGQRSGY